MKIHGIWIFLICYCFGNCLASIFVQDKLKEEVKVLQEKVKVLEKNQIKKK